MKRLILFLLLLFVVGCYPSTPTVVSPTDTPVVVPSVVATLPIPPSNASWLPNHALHPGRLNPAITNAQDFVAKICQGGTGQFRPPVADTNHWKNEIAAQEGISNWNPANFEGDHLVPLALAGYPGAEGQFQNFWDEPRSGTHPASEKDVLETWAYHNACANTYLLAGYQTAFETDWTTLLATAKASMLFQSSINAVGDIDGDQ